MALVHPRLEDAVDILLEQTERPLRAEPVPLLEAFDRVALHNIRARIDHPPFDSSPLDGYALAHEDIAGAGLASPVRIKVTQCIYAGDTPAGPLGPGEAAKVTTGAPLPHGATCVVRQEDSDYGSDNVEIFVSARKHENYRFKGEDISAGQLLVERGRRLSAMEIGLLAGQGFREVVSVSRPHMGIIATGSELAAESPDLPPGKIHDINSYLLAARAKSLGAVPVMGAAVLDDPLYLSRAVLDLAHRSDFVISTGGVSQGEHDFMPRVAEILGAEILFRGVTPKLGGPCLAMKLNDKVILCLSGNPYAAATAFELLARPVLRQLAGEAEALLPRIKAVLHDPFPRHSVGRRFLQGRLEGSRIFLPVRGRTSVTLPSLYGCNCLVDIPAGTPPLVGGETVEAILF